MCLLPCGFCSSGLGWCGIMAGLRHIHDGDITLTVGRHVLAAFPVFLNWFLLIYYRISRKAGLSSHEYPAVKSAQCLFGLLDGSGAGQGNQETGVRVVSLPTELVSVMKRKAPKGLVTSCTCVRSMYT